MKKPSQIQELADALGGLAVFGVIPGSPAALCGVRYGDVVLTTNGYATRTLDEFFRARGACESFLEVEVFRDGQLIRLSASLQPGKSPTLEHVAHAVVRAGMLPKTPEPTPRKVDRAEYRWRS